MIPIPRSQVPASLKQSIAHYVLSNKPAGWNWKNNGIAGDETELPCVSFDLISHSEAYSPLGQQNVQGLFQITLTQAMPSYSDASAYGAELAAGTYTRLLQRHGGLKLYKYDAAGIDNARYCTTVNTRLSGTVELGPGTTEDNTRSIVLTVFYECIIIVTES